MTNRYSIRAVYHGPAYLLRGMHRFTDNFGVFVIHDGECVYLELFR